MKPLGLTDEEINVADVEELRFAYRELLIEARRLRALISERTGVAVDDLRARGLKYNGNLPYGLECDEKTKKLKSSRYENRLIDEIKKLHAAGLSLRAISRTLADRRFVNRDSRPIDAKQIARILDAAGIKRESRLRAP